jgi:hypothetical protein
MIFQNSFRMFGRVIAMAPIRILEDIVGRGRTGAGLRMPGSGSMQKS